MRALLLKELRALFPIYVVVFLAISGDIFMRPFSERLDEATWASISSLFNEPGGVYAFALAILALVAAYAAYPREFDDRTIEFLHALPVPRSTVFLTKAGAGILVLCLGVIGGTVTDGLMTAMNPQSIVGEQWDLRTAAVSVFLRCALATVFYCHALLFSFFRRLGLIPFFCIGYVLLFAKDVSTHLAVLDPVLINGMVFEGQTLLIPWSSLALHLPLALISLAFAYLLWTKSGERTAFVMNRAHASTAGRVGLGCATLAVVFTGFVLTIALSLMVADDLEEPPGETIEYISFATATAETEHLHLTYPVSLRDRALPLISVVEERYEALGNALGHVELPEVTIDLTESSSQHLGIASWSRVRVGLVLHPNFLELDHTVTHELAHVLQHQISEQGIGRESRSTHLFTEGSAEYLAYEVVPMPEARQRARNAASLMWQRHRLRLDELVDSRITKARWDSRVVYYLGEVFAAAIVDSCPEPAIGNVLTAIARPEAPRGLEPVAFWSDTLSAINCSYETVTLRFEEILRDNAEDNAAFIESIPRPSGGVTDVQDGVALFYFSLDRALPDGARMSVIVRRSEESAAETLMGRLTATEEDPLAFEGRVVLPFGAETFQFEVALHPSEDHWAVYEPFRNARVP